MLSRAALALAQVCPADIACLQGEKDSAQAIIGGPITTQQGRLREHISIMLRMPKLGTIPVGVAEPGCGDVPRHVVEVITSGYLVVFHQAQANQLAQTV